MTNLVDRLNNDTPNHADSVDAAAEIQKLKQLVAHWIGKHDALLEQQLAQPEQAIAKFISSQESLTPEMQQVLDAMPYETTAQPVAQPLPMTDEQIRAAFGKWYPNDIGILELSENNKDFRMDAIGARHHWIAFRSGAISAESFHGIGAKE